MQEIKIHAPVIIPTLNRYVHFKRCLESLERCTGAEQTDVYVGLDYPPSEKYVEGWNLIDAYLAEKEKKNKFKKLIVFRRDHNCGVGKEGSNSGLLLAEVKLLYDRYIFSEDDNEFSPNFLVFINKGLELYKEDPKIMGISGYSYPIVSKKYKSSKIVAMPQAALWGYGRWFSKKYTYDIIRKENYMDSILFSLKKSFFLLIKRPYSLNTLLSMKFRNRFYGDSLVCTELVLKDIFFVFPVISKVRNWGCDGTGLHSGFSQNFDKQEIDENLFFEYGKLDFVKTTDFYNRWRIPGVERLVITMVSFVRYIYFRITQKDLFSFYFGKKKQ